MSNRLTIKDFPRSFEFASSLKVHFSNSCLCGVNSGSVFLDIVEDFL